MAIISTAKVSVSTSTPQDQPDNSDVLAALTRECGKRDIILAVTEDTDVEAALVDIYGRRVLVTTPDDFHEALDDLRGLGLCCHCHKELDDTATPYYPGYNHRDGSPIMICAPCRTEQARIAADPNRLAFSRCMDAIEAVFKASANPEMTRTALREFVDLTADGMKPGVPA